jgi:hypothetical protein
VNPLYPVVAERVVYRCKYCHAPEAVFNFPFEVEHIFPQAHGDSDDLENLALLGPGLTGRIRDRTLPVADSLAGTEGMAYQRDLLW